MLRRALIIAAMCGAMCASVAHAQTMPPTNRAWTGKDYQTALKVLRKRSVLPRHGSAVFKRMTSRANLAVLSSTAVGVSTRAKLGNELQRGSNQIFKLYLAKMMRSTARSYYRREVIEFSIYMLAVSGAFMPLVPKLFASLPAEQRRSKIRLQGLAKMRLGLAGQIGGALITLQETKIYSVGDRRRLARQLVGLLPPLAPMLTPTHRAQLTASLEALARQADDKHIRAAMRRARARLP